MFSSIDKSKGLLFVTHELSYLLGRIMQSMAREIDRLDAERFLNTAPDDLKQYLVGAYSVAPLKLLRDQWHADHREIQIDVSNDQGRWITDRSRPFMIAGERFEVRVPFEGDPEHFYARADKFSLNPPRASIEGNELVLRYDSTSDSPRDVRSLVDNDLAEIEKHIGWQRNLVDAHNSALVINVEQVIQQRRARLLAQSQRAESLGIPIRRRNDAPQTFAIPTARRKVVPSLPPATSSQFTPEPTWAMEQYEQALKIMQDMALVMERSPEAFKSMDEEALRQHFLVQLNGQFEGKATGETFNMAGKTDILLREGDRNVFIAECKIWRGPKSFSEAIDQLLSYATWRDSKAAILLFNRGVDTSKVLKSIDATTRAHANFKRELNWPHESGFRYIVHAVDDANREITVTVLVFHVPV